MFAKLAGGVMPPSWQSIRRGTDATSTSSSNSEAATTPTAQSVVLFYRPIRPCGFPGHPRSAIVHAVPDFIWGMAAEEDPVCESFTLV
jgi:hypothetical protein